jgi:hypothetical protein
VCFESRLGLLDHLSKLEQNYESSEISRNREEGIEQFNENDGENASSKLECKWCQLNFNGSADLSQHLKVHNKKNKART